MRPKLVVITDWSMGEAALLSALSEVCALGPDVAVQHRHPGATDRDLLREARLVSSLCSRHGAEFFVNGRVDLALLAGAHLHLPSRGPDVAEVRRVLPPARMISVAVHDELEAARADGADFALVSPVFGAGSKPGDPRPPLGVEGFERLRAALPCPAFALGGISPETALRLASADGFVAVTGVLRARSPGEAARSLLRAVTA